MRFAIKSEDYLTKNRCIFFTAVEEAIRLRERTKSVTSITALSIGPSKSVETLRTALAMGADSAIHILTPDAPSPSSNPEPINVARAIKAVVDRSKANGGTDLIILGKQAIDDDSGSTGGMLAGMLGWGQGTFASKLEVEKEGKVVITREIDGGLAKVEGKLPMIVTTDLRLNGKFDCNGIADAQDAYYAVLRLASTIEPRYASLVSDPFAPASDCCRPTGLNTSQPNIMKAKKKKVETLKPEDLGLDFVCKTSILPMFYTDVVVKQTPRMEVLSVSEPAKRVGGGKVENVDELVAKLKEAGIV